jgi:predicted transcriptional regulator
MEIAKEQAKKVLDTLPDSATWDDIMYKIYVTQKIHRGLEDLRNGTVITHEEVKKRFSSE